RWRSRHDHGASMSTTPGAAGRPYWSEVLRTLREARGVTQEGWGAQVGVSGPTVRRWESGGLVPNAEAEVAVLAACAAHGLFRRYDHGPQAGVTVTPAWLSELLAQARITLRRAEPERAITAAREPATLPTSAATAAEPAILTTPVVAPAPASAPS